MKSMKSIIRNLHLLVFGISGNFRRLRSVWPETNDIDSVRSNCDVEDSVFICVASLCLTIDDNCGVISTEPDRSPSPMASSSLLLSVSSVLTLCTSFKCGCCCSIVCVSNSIDVPPPSSRSDDSLRVGDGESSSKSGTILLICVEIKRNENQDYSLSLLLHS